MDELNEIESFDRDMREFLAKRSRLNALRVIVVILCCLAAVAGLVALVAWSYS